MRFEANYHECKENDNYKLLQSNMAQQTLRAVDFAFKSFFSSVGKVRSAHPPRYRKKGGLYNLIITGNSISIQDGSSFLDLDELPVYNVETPYTGTFSGKRIQRGLYSSKNGRLINADVNGAANILRKSKQRLDLERLYIWFLDNPLRIRAA